MLSTANLSCRISIILAIISWLAPPLAYGADNQPNVIFILVDDLGYGDLGVHGNPRLRTPNIDQLSRESIRFDHHHVSPMCTPTRGELMTGMDAFRNGASATEFGRSMPRQELTLMPEIFRDSGYATAHFGKWHLGHNYPFRPNDRGFDLSIHNNGWGTSAYSEHYQNDAFDDHYWRNNELLQFMGYNTDVFFNEAMNWMKQQKKPFFTYLATTASHKPHYVESRYEKPYEDLDSDVLGAFYGMTTQLDENVGRLIKFLDDNNLSRNTILIYMSDNGTVDRTRYYTAGLRGRKTSLYEGGHRVPFFMAWPEGINGGSRQIDTLTHSTDLLPTLIDLAGLKLNKPIAFDGQSLVPLIEQKTHDLADRKLVIQYGKELIKWKSAILWENWRLVKGNELYDLSKDLGQVSNIYNERPDIVKVMRDYYEGWFAETEKIDRHENNIIVGSPEETVTRLTSDDWVGLSYSDWAGTSPPAYGHWNIMADKTTDYIFSLSLYPPEANIAITEPFRNAKARNISGAHLYLNNKKYKIKTSPEDTRATIQVALKRGEKYRADGRFLNAEGKEFIGTVYLLIQAIK